MSQADNTLHAYNHSHYSFITPPGHVQLDAKQGFAFPSIPERLKRGVYTYTYKQHLLRLNMCSAYPRKYFTFPSLWEIEKHL